MAGIVRSCHTAAHGRRCRTVGRCGGRGSESRRRASAERPARPWPATGERSAPIVSPAPQIDGRSARSTRQARRPVQPRRPSLQARDGRLALAHPFVAARGAEFMEMRIVRGAGIVRLRSADEAVRAVSLQPGSTEMLAEPKRGARAPAGRTQVVLERAERRQERGRHDSTRPPPVSLVQIFDTTLSKYRHFR